MRRLENKRQVLTSGRVDYNGNKIDPSVIDWSDFDKNPVLLYNPETEGHFGVVVGRVVDRKDDGREVSAALEFVSGVKEADAAFAKYEQGALKFVSVGGYAIGEVKDGVFVASKYTVREVSLVKLPANIDCKQINASEMSESDRELFQTRDGEQIRYVTMAEKIEEAPEEKPVNAEEAPEEKPVNAEEAQANNERHLPAGMKWHEQQEHQSFKKQAMKKSFRELNCDAEFQARMNAVTAAFRGGAQVSDMTPENAQTVQVLASSMLAEEAMVILASVTNYTDAVTRERKNALQVLVDCAAGNATSATLAAADLGVIKYLSLFYAKLRANDTFMRSLRIVPMSDKAGAIYVEDNIKAPMYVGNNTPLDATVYQYEDIKRTIARRVFAFAPVLFQHSELDILAYDKRSRGIASQMAASMEAFATYVLQVIANTPGVSKIKSSGTKTYSTSGMFPIEAPNSAVTAKAITLDDVIAMESDFLMQNYSFANGKNIEMVMPARLYGMLAADGDVRSRLIRELNGKMASEINFSATRITPRNPVARVDSSDDNAELDPSMYADKNVADDGTATDITPATTTATHVGAGVAFVENEVIAGVGAIELIVERDPRNYGTLISGWFSGGATVARSNGQGAGLIIPGIAD